MGIQMNKGLQQYRSVDVGASVQTASPHELIAMLLRGGLTALARAAGAIERKDISERGVQLNKAIAIVFELKESLDMEKGGEIASNLDGLYTYMIRQITLANRENSLEKVDEVRSLLSEILEGWGGIPPEFRKQVD